MSKGDDYINFILTDFFIGTNLRANRDWPEWLSTAKKYCGSLKKNTYYAYKKKYSIYAPEVFDSGPERGDDGKYRISIRFICAENNNAAFAIAKFDGPIRRDYWERNKNKVVIYEFKRELSAQEVRENKVKAEKERLAKIERDREEIEKNKKLKAKEKQNKIDSLEISFGESCSANTFKKGFVKGTQEYENCLFEKEKEEIAKQKSLDEKLARMTPVERREYNCENAFKFRRGSNDFNQCIFKLYMTELEIEKLELQKQVAIANERAALAQAKAAASEKARAEALVVAQIAAANAQKAAARASSLASSISLMQLGNSMLRGNSSSSSTGMNEMGRIRTTCRNVGGFINCY